MIIGAGPAGLGYLERLVENIRRDATDRGFDIHAVDPHPAGAGRIWRYEQAPELLLNSQAYDITIFPDEAFTGEGPLPAGDPADLTFLGWLARVRAGELPLAVQVDEAIRAEIAAIRPDSFPSRRVMALYLRWAFRHVVDGRPDNVAISTHRGAVVDVSGGRPAPLTVTLDTGEVITGVDSVIYTVGHSESEPDLEERESQAFAAEHGLVYVPPKPAASEFVDPVAPGSTVILRGIGLTAFDTIALLTEHRGGVYSRDEDGVLRYRPSGKEPFIFVGSRRGVPPHTVPSTSLVGPATRPLHFTLAKARRIAEETPSISFRSDFLPLIQRDLARRVYAELFAAFPERVTLGWPAFVEAFDRTPFGSEAYEALVADSIPSAEHRLDLKRLSHPLGETFSGTSAQYQEAVRAFLAGDLARHRNDSTTTALRVALRDAQNVIALLRWLPNWDGDSLVGEVYRDWYPFFCSVAIGPSQDAQERLLALSKAGVVTFLGPWTRVERNRDQSCFVGFSDLADVRVEATALIDARIPEPTVERSRNPALASLAASAAGAEAIYPSAKGTISTGRLRVNLPAGFLVDAAGSIDRRRQALGAFVSGNWVSAFALPGSDFPFFRQTDQAARATLEVLLGDSRADSAAGELKA